MDLTTNRRQFIKGAVSTAGVVASLGSGSVRALAADPGNIQLGSTPDSWGVWFGADSLQLPWQRFLDEVQEAGYRAIELGPYGYLPNQASDLRLELDRRKLQISAGYVRAPLESTPEWPGLEKQVMLMGELLTGAGAKHLILIDDTYAGYFTGRPASPRHLDERAWKQLIDTTHRVASLASSKFGLKLVFHPCAYTHVEDLDEIELFLDQTDPSLVSLCLDTGHLAFHEIDPAAFMRRHHRRVAYLHLQDVDGKVRKQVIALGNTLYVNAVGRGLFCEPGKGAVNFAAFRDALKETQFSGWAIVEQEMYPVAWDMPLPLAARSLAYFRGAGFS